MMAKDLNATGRWLKRITQTFSGEPQDREEFGLMKLNPCRINVSS